MPKPFVHLLGPPLDLAGNHGRFASSGCRPNAILRLYYVTIPIA